VKRRRYALASQRKELKGFTYVYILLSEKDPTHRYTGLTDDLEARLKSHNQGNNPHTSRYRPWQIETAIAFRSREKAAAFEKYLKSHSGRAFSNLMKILEANFLFLIESIRSTNILFSISIGYYINAHATTFALSRQSFRQYSMKKVLNKMQNPVK
jgi:predicted GIY-YIG superfamily endonuclease